MLSIGFTELIVLVLILVVVVGPEGLPRMMRDLGRMYGRLRRAADELRRAFVLEADRQDAEDRFKQLQERRKAAREAREKAKAAAGEGAVVQEAPLPGLAPDAEGEPPGEDLPDDDGDPEAPAPAAQSSGAGVP